MPYIIVLSFPLVAKLLCWTQKVLDFFYDKIYKK